VKPKKGKPSHSSLVLGWSLTPNLDPVYWLNRKAKPGQQSESDLVKVPAGLAATHTAIIAQSGSGKSFFLGRLIEELCLRTKARCLVLDPNSDFSRIYEAQDPKVWREAGYDALKRRGSLPHESSRESFLEQWSQVSVRVRTGAGASVDKVEKLKLRWSSVSAAFLAEDLDPMLRGELYHAHAFVKAMEWLLLYKNPKGSPPSAKSHKEQLSTQTDTPEEIDLIAEAEKLLGRGRELPEAGFRAEIEANFPVPSGASLGALDVIPILGVLGKFLQPFARSFVRNERLSRIEVLSKGPRYISPGVERFYFGKAREYQAAGIVESRPSRAKDVSPRQLEVVNLPSFDRNTQLLVTDAILSEEWDRAKIAWNNALKDASEKDSRVPTFIVVDEAHNLIPADPRTPADAALRERFRTIVAEGRKYGLFLILVSQRPDKVDTIVLSECENRAVMKLSSMSVLKLTRERLGLDDMSTRLLEKCLEFETGRILLIGNWAPQAPQLAYCAARRTVEGGRNLREASWAIPQNLGTVATKQKGRKAKGPQSATGKQSPPLPPTGTDAAS
jgi:hypothetical protein